MTTIHTRQLTTIHTRQLQQYTRQLQQYTHKYNNTHTTTTIHTTKLTTIHTIQPVQTVNNTTVRKYCIQFAVFFPTHTVLTLSPQPFTSHYFTTHINFSHKVSCLPPSLQFTSLHLTLVRFTSLHELHDFREESY